MSLGASSDPAIRVAHVGDFEPESANGVHRTIAGLLRHLPSHGVDVELWTLSSTVTVPRWSRRDGIRVLELPARRRPWNALGLPATAVSAIRARCRGIDVVHFHSVYVPDNVHAARALSVPYVITPNGGYDRRVIPGTNRAVRRLWWLGLERPYVEGAAALHAVSPPETADLSRRFGAVRVVEAPNAVEDDWLLPDVTTPEGRDLLFLGRLAVDHKGLDLLLRGVAEVPGRTGVRLILGGPDFRGGEARLARLARDLGIEDRIELRPPVFGAAKRSLLRSCLAFVHTSRWEGLPFAVLEALAVGRPALVTPETNLAGLVDEHGAGVVVDGTPRDIARGIVSLLDATPAEHEAMRHRARELVASRFVWDRSTAELAAGYRRIVAGRQVRPAVEPSGARRRP